MPHDHAAQSGHAHHHHIDPEAGDKKVIAAIAVNIALTVAQIVAGLIAGSLALVADAIHNLSDAISLGIAFAARKIGRRPSDKHMTFGYERVEIVAALINYTTLIVIALYLGYEGVLRLIDPQPVTGWIVVIVAGFALVIDMVTALLTYRMAQHSVNMKAAFLHNVADALGSVAVIVAGSLILLYDWRIVDPLVTLGISAYILWQSWGGLKPVVRMLMLGAPVGTDAEEVLAAMRAMPDVTDVHHLHLWQMDESRTALEAHIVTEGDMADIRAGLRQMLERRFGIDHSTLEIERPEHACQARSGDGIGCIC